MKPIPKAGIVFKSSLVLSGKAAKDNFTTEPRSPSRLLGRIEPICNRSEGFDEVLLRARGQTIPPFWVVRQCQLIRISWLVQFALFKHLYLFHKQLSVKSTDSVDSSRLVLVHHADCAGVTNSKLVTTNHGRQLRGSPSIGHSLSVGGSAQTTVITLSGWSGALRGEIAVKWVRV
ncbi:hypothetical protein ACFQHW_00660 [Lapidilactobacillus achengensis]|uniref:Uncharacterized protein n=2 Tax=Lapidilactobacillus achengensis TaxID=2486000 RepID=A0ABW1UK40_9LACO|nr:hypothetical protein [Lapidilactobacillus achengensis]